MASSLSNFVNSLSEGIHRIKCKYGRGDTDSFPESTNFKDYLTEYICL